LKLFVCEAFAIHLQMRSGFFSECEGGAPHSLRPSGMLLLQKVQVLFVLQALSHNHENRSCKALGSDSSRTLPK
jgi:hypothetical protein